MDQDLNRTWRRSRADPKDPELQARLRRAEECARLYLTSRLEIRGDDELWLLDGAAAKPIPGVELYAAHGTDYFYPYFHRFVVELFRRGRTLVLRHEQIFDDTYSQPDSSTRFYQRQGEDPWRVLEEGPELATFEKLDAKDCSGRWVDCGCMACRVY